MLTTTTLANPERLLGSARNSKGYRLAALRANSFGVARRFDVLTPMRGHDDGT